MEEKNLTTLETGKRLNVSTDRLRQWRHLGHGPAFTKFGRDAFYLRSEVERFKKLLDANGGRYARCMELQK